MQVFDIFNENRVVLNLSASSKEDVIKKMAALLYNEQVVTDTQEYVASVLSREAHATTGVGNGIAIPHGKSSAVKEPAIAFAKLSQEIEWEALDEQPVTIVVMLAVPESDKGATHLSLLSEIAVKLMDEEVVEQLKKVTENTEVISLLTKK